MRISSTLEEWMKGKSERGKEEREREGWEERERVN